ncbi:MAG: hypothetical protein K9J21_06980 [Bacteroidales bacterium]|nr:hypothetical protein [Bacteroidales bacterium]
MAYLKTIKIARDLLKVIYPKNSFYTQGRVDNRDGTVKTIKYNYANKISRAKQGDNPTLPLTLQSYDGDTSEYYTDEVYAGPILIEREDELLTDISQYQDVLDQLKEAMETSIADVAAVKYGPTILERIFLTSGTDTRTTTMTGSTSGSRKKISKDDIIKVKTALAKDQVGGQIVGLITPDMHDDLLGIPEFVDYEKTGVKSKLVEGAIGRLMGIEFMIRWNEELGHAGIHYTQAKAKKDNYTSVGAINNASNDGAAALFYIKNYVRYSKMPVNVSVARNVPQYKGATILGTQTRFGATISRQHDERGVIALVEATTS